MKRSSNLLRMDGSEWWTAESEAKIDVILPRRAKISEIRIQWWGISRAKEFSISLDDFKIIEFKEKKCSGYNFWTTVNTDHREEIQKITLDLRKGVEDPWKMKKKLGIRQILIFGKMQDGEKDSLENFILKTFTPDLADTETKLIVPFLLSKV